MIHESLGKTLARILDSKRNTMHYICIRTISSCQDDFIRTSIQTIKQGAIRSITCCIKFVTTILDKVFTSINYLIQILFCIRHITIFTISSLIQSCTSLKG
ncbi:Uncharacterised protein [Segatella copri]|nr:Uncharacterised protein [Segatella copri]